MIDLHNHQTRPSKYEMISRTSLYPVALVALFICSQLSFVYSAQSKQLESGDILDIIPAIIAASGGACDSSSLTLLRVNCTLEVGTDYNLRGETIIVPRGVTFEFFGGAIRNGTLVFEDGLIDGRLLNSSLKIEGRGKLLNPVFIFEPAKWAGIVQGRTTETKALKNTAELERLMFWTKRLGATVFQIGKFDAYFDVTKVTSTTSDQNFYPSVEAINVPSDFHLKMSSNTVLRVFPTNISGGVLMALRDVSNVMVSGGVLLGDRDLHIYGPNSGDEGQLLLELHSATHSVIDGVKLTMGSAGGLNINSLGFTFQPDFYKPSNNLVIRNCVFDNNRRMNTSITDGHDILIENNRYLNAGQDSAYIDGGEVGYAINIEALRDRDSNGNLRFYERAYDITIRNNIERGSKRGAFVVAIGENITIEGNDLENRAELGLTSGSKIISNTFNGSSRSTDNAIGSDGEGDSVFGNEISGNTIRGFDTGVSIYNGAIDVFDNTIVDSDAGMQFKEIVKATNVYQNKIINRQPGSTGFRVHLTYADKLNITNNEVDVTGSHVITSNLNLGAGAANNRVVVSGNTFLTSAAASSAFSESRGVLFENNVSDGKAQVVNSSDIQLISNQFISTDGNGVSINGVNTDIEVTGNTISYPANTSFKCISIDNTTNPAQVSLVNNTFIGI